MSPDQRDGYEVLTAAIIAAVVGTIGLFFLVSIGMYEPLQAAPAPEPTTFTACPDCHTERHPGNGCGKLRGQAWEDCVQRHFEERVQPGRERE